MCCDNLIKRPNSWRHARSASTIPGLSLKERQQLHESIHSAARKYLDNVSWRRQTPEKTAYFMREIVEKLPFLARYEDAWPAEGCMREHLMRRKDRDQSINCAPIGRVRPRRHDAIMRNKSPALQAEHAKGPEFGNLAPRRRTGEDAVRAFLKSISPRMDGLALVFVQGGIVDEEHVEALANFPEAEQVKFLRRDLELNALQARIVRLALLARKASSSKTPSRIG